MKKFWKYFVILIPFILTITFFVARKMFAGNNFTANDLNNAISNVKDKLWEANTVHEVEKTIAKTKEAEQVKQLVEIKKINDGKERRKRLAEMLNQK